PAAAAGAVLHAGEPRLRLPERPPPRGDRRSERPSPRPADLARRPARLAQHAHVFRPGAAAADPCELLLRPPPRRLPRRRQGGSAAERPRLLRTLRPEAAHLPEGRLGQPR